MEETKEMMARSHLSEREREKGRGLLALRYWAMVGPCRKGKKREGNGLRCGQNGEGRERGPLPLFYFLSFSIFLLFLFSYFEMV